MGTFGQSRSRRRPGADSGVAAIEFALVIVPFLYLCVSIAEVGATVLAQTTLDNAVAAVAGDISNGTVTAQSGALSAEEIRTRICGQGSLPFLSKATCGTRLLVDLRSIASGDTVPSAILDGAVNASAFTSSSLGGSDIVLVRAAVSVPRISPLWRPGLANLDNGDHLVVSAAMAPLPAAGMGGAP